MPKYQIVLAQDVPCYWSTIVEASSPQEATAKALALANNSECTFEPEWDLAGDVRIACDPEECELP
jgi:hypothetical protein